MAHGIEFLNANGAPELVAGDLGGGDVGVAVVNDGGQLVKLTALAFGPAAETVTTSEGTLSTTYTTLLTAGPTLDDVLIGDTGRAIVIMSARIIYSIGFSGNSLGGGAMGFTVSGASSLPADDDRSLVSSHNQGGVNAGLESASSRVVFLSGLAKGLHSFSARYRSFSAASPCGFQDRHLIVVPF